MNLGQHPCTSQAASSTLRASFPHAFKSSHLPPNRLSRPRGFSSSLGSAAQLRLREMSSSPNHKSPAAGDAGAQADDKPRLTEEEKKQNHIASEQKRRQAIREGFDRLTELVPGLEGQGRSEGLVLKRTVDYMREQLVERQAMIERIEQAGGGVDDKLKRALYQQAGSGQSRARG
ncbi:hypothetical protein BGZ61DRAFT_443011 [Ilyonectria robusta]|uniref:uncharacterized protein n=1 Tax=Ilyonectria robusta TaxID=1079257 RepID=UPI001E8CC412|nr:uncharacterized protein BGZ61DRAFT_443011 [Ilyonectria robusta]KAH8734721.1 hypothetical protein BGZ61DRAFT_443011 [Ilyonectria robusta]